MSLAWLRRIPSWQVTLGAALLALGFLIAAQLGAEGPRVRYTTQERSPLLETATELQAQQEELKNRILVLREAIGGVEGQSTGSADLVRQLNTELQEARIAAGLIPLTGTGMVLQLDDSQARHPVRGGGAVDRRRGGDRDQRRAGHADHGDHRYRLVVAGELSVSRAPVPGRGHRSG
jgi:uncharacterized protein YlxW (UPF0749 family)